MANQLIHEDSPYLQQHKDNLVNWYPWCDEAFERAKNEHKAIFLSIGYSSCHWCHVMKKEVFENEELAKYLNDHFISIKVDKEERPDIDKHFQEVHMLLNRRPASWPTSIFLTPENRPFYAATYIPPQNKHQKMGFDELTRIIATKVADNDEALFKNADEIVHFLKQENRPKEGTKLDLMIKSTFFKQALHNYDQDHGGFSMAPKFPHASTLHTLLDLYQLDDNHEALNMVKKTLTSMQQGGLYDLVDGGFCHCSTDQSWLVPHFEKMTYDNALLISLYLRAFELTQEIPYQTTAFESIDFMLSRMQEAHLFYSSSDAYSDAHEGKYFVYDYEQTFEAFTKVLGSTDAKEAMDYFSITKDGNFEGKNIIRTKQQNRPQWYEKAKEVLYDLRDEKLYPFIDKKVILSWSAMMIKALYHASVFDTKYLYKAESALDALLKKLYINDKLFHTALVDKEAKVAAFLEDYAYLAQTLLFAYQITSNEQHLLLAQKLANEALMHFFDKGHWYFSKKAFVTNAEISDSSYPGSIAIMVDVLLDLGNLVDAKYRDFAFQTLEYNSYNLMRQAIKFPQLCSAAIKFLSQNFILKFPSSYESQLNLYKANRMYPFITLQKSHEEHFMLCDQQSCFTSSSSDLSLLDYFETFVNDMRKS